MDQNGKSYRDLLAGDGEKLAFLIMTNEFDKANEIIASYEDSAAFKDRSDPDLYISVLFFKAWYASEFNFGMSEGRMDEASILDEVMEFVPSTPRQKIMQLISRQFADYDRDYRILKKALNISRKDPALLRERALALHFFEDIFDKYEESGVIYAREENVCLEVLYGPQSWQKLYSDARLAKAVVRNEGKEKGIPMCIEALEAIHHIDEDHRLIEAVALFDFEALFPDDKSEEMKNERVRIVTEHGSQDNPFLDPTFFLNDKNLLSQKLKDAERRGVSPEEILTLFYRNSWQLPDEQSFACFDLVLRALEQKSVHGSKIYKKVISRIGEIGKMIKDQKALQAYFLEKAAGFDSETDEAAFRSFCDVVNGLPASIGLEVVLSVEKNLPSDHRYEYILLGVKADFLRALSRHDELSQCTARLVKGYEALDIERDEAYYLAYYDMGSDALENGKTSRFIRYTKKAAEGLESILGYENKAVLKCYCDLEDHYSDNGSDEDSFEYVISIFDRLVSYYESHNNSKLAYLMMSDKARYLLKMGRSDDSLEMQRRTYEFILDKEGPLSSNTADARHTYGCGLFLHKEYDRAAAMLEESNSILADGSLDKIDCQCVLMLIYNHGGRSDEAYALARALRPLEKKMNPMHKVILYRTLCDMYLDAGDFRMSDKMMDKVERVMPDSKTQEGDMINGRVSSFMPIGFKF